MSWINTFSFTIALLRIFYHRNRNETRFLLLLLYFGVFGSYVLEFLIYWLLTPHQICNFQIFTLIMSLLSGIIFARRSFKFHVNPFVYYCFFSVYFLGLLQDFLTNFNVRNIFSVFLYKSFIVSALMFTSCSFQIDVCNCKKHKSSFSLSHVAIQFYQYNLLKRLSFLWYILSIFVEKSVGYRCVDSLVDHVFFSICLCICFHHNTVIVILFYFLFVCMCYVWRAYMSGKKTTLWRSLSLLLPLCRIQG